MVPDGEKSQLKGPIDVLAPYTMDGLKFGMHDVFERPPLVHALLERHVKVQLLLDLVEERVHASHRFGIRTVDQPELRAHGTVDAQ